MIVQDNEEINKEIEKLIKQLEKLPYMLRQMLIFTEEGREVDAIDGVADLDNNVFEIRKLLFDSKVDVDKIRKHIGKHISHCLNPIPKTAPKKTKTSARKKKDAEIRTLPTFEDSVKAVDKTVKNLAKKPESTKNLAKSTMTITRGNANKTNPAHDKPFE